MSITRFDDECSGCRPALLDARTGHPLPDDSVEMTVILQLWREASLEERRAWHRFSCQNSREPRDLQFAKVFSDRVGLALSSIARRSTAES